MNREDLVDLIFGLVIFCVLAGFYLIINLSRIKNEPGKASERAQDGRSTRVEAPGSGQADPVPGEKPS